MKKTIISTIFCLLALGASAQTFKEWQDPTLNEVNRAPMHTNYFAFGAGEAVTAPEASANYLTLHGNWKFNWVNSADQRPTGFWNASFDDKGWDTMVVPGIWELNGYGDPVYVNTGWAWRNQFTSNPPEIPV